MEHVTAGQGVDQVDWRHRAACRDEDPELFHPVGPGGPVLSEIAEAKAVCARCTVQPECLEWALVMGVSGIWGGTSKDERRALKHRAAASGGSTIGEAMSA